MNFGFVKALTGALYATILVKLIILVLSKATLETAKRRGIHGDFQSKQSVDLNWQKLLLER